jgi:hypothetical protein
MAEEMKKTYFFSAELEPDGKYVFSKKPNVPYLVENGMDVLLDRANQILSMDIQPSKPYNQHEHVEDDVRICFQLSKSGKMLGFVEPYKGESLHTSDAPDPRAKKDIITGNRNMTRIDTGTLRGKGRQILKPLAKKLYADFFDNNDVSTQGIMEYILFNKMQELKRNGKMEQISI